MIYNKKALENILQEYLRKLPGEDISTLKIDIGDHDIRFSIEGDINVIRIVNVIVNVVLKHIEFGETSKFFIFDVSFSIEEAIINLYTHSYDGRAGRVEVEMCFKDDRLIVTISDYGEKGIELDLNAVLSAPPIDKFAPKGRGLMLIRKAVDEIEYQTQNGKNTLQLVKKIR